MSTLIAVPVLGRPHRVGPLLDSIEAATPEAHRVLFIANKGDDPEIAAVNGAGAELLVMPYRHRPVDWERQPGDWARKLNRAVRESDEEFVFLAADDLDFHPGWLPAALARMVDGIGVVGTNDLGSPRVIAGLHATHNLISRVYVEQHGTIDERGKALCELYPHEGCDDELVQTAKYRNAWAFASDSVVEHLHPNWGKAQPDEIYRLQRQRMKVGLYIYDQRKRLWGNRERG